MNRDEEGKKHTTLWMTRKYHFSIKRKDDARNKPHQLGGGGELNSKNRKNGQCG